MQIIEQVCLNYARHYKWHTINGKCLLKSAKESKSPLRTHCGLLLVNYSTYYGHERTQKIHRRLCGPEHMG